MRCPRTSLFLVMFGVACGASNGGDDDDGPLTRRILPPISDWPLPDHDASLHDSDDGEQNESPNGVADAGAIGIPSDPNLPVEQEDAATSGPSDGDIGGFPTDDGGCGDAGDEVDPDAAESDAGCAEPLEV